MDWSLVIWFETRFFFAVLFAGVVIDELEPRLRGLSFRIDGEEVMLRGWGKHDSLAVELKAACGRTLEDFAVSSVATEQPRAGKWR